MIIDGAGTSIDIKAGDHFIFEPGEAHQLVNHSPEELVYIIVADHQRADVTTYPKSAKCGVAPEHRFFRIADVDYFDGEE